MRPLLSALAVCVGVSTAAAAESNLAVRARTTLDTWCSRCHGVDSPGKGGFSHVLDRDRLVARNRVVPGDPSASPLYQRVVQGEMPPREQKKRPTPDEIALLRQWIEAGAPAVMAAGPRTFLPEAEVRGLVNKDLKQAGTTQRRFFRYFTLANLYNAGASEEELERTRQALAKLLNSLSWHPRIARPLALGPGGALLRIDLRDYQWSRRTWEHLVGLYPYRTDYTGELPVLRGDWFLATAIRPPVYYDLLQLPFTDRELERQLRVDVLRDLDEETAARAGFNDSGVARNNRILERHHSSYGAYWRSYDFLENTDDQNLFDRPLGPVPGRKAFRHSGGEIIFDLPNGLHGYFLVDRDGRRLDRAPIEIVSDPKRPDKTIEVGVSCVSCHFSGILPKTDQVRAHVEKNAAAFGRADLETVRALYLPAARFRALVDEDNEHYRNALKKAGVREGEPEPVTAAVQRYEGTLDLRAAAAEFGLRAEELAQRLERVPGLARSLGALRVSGGTVSRETFLAAYSEIVRTFGLGESSDLGTAEPLRQPFQGHAGSVSCLAFAADGKRAVSGGEDGTLRVWDTATGRELRCIEGPAGSGSAVVFSPDGKSLAAARERTLHLWDAESGREVRQFRGHTDLVQCLVFSPDGRWIASGGRERCLRLWDAATGREVRTFGGHSGGVHALAFSRDGRRLTSGGRDGAVRVWDTESGRELGTLEGHAGEVYSLAPSGNDKLAAGTAKGIVIIWDLNSGKETQRLAAAEGAIVALQWAADGRCLLTGASQHHAATAAPLRVWDVASGKEVSRFLGESVESVQCVAFTADGRAALTGGAGGTIQWW